jgi:hypothetical protein
MQLTKHGSYILKPRATPDINRQSCSESIQRVLLLSVNDLRSLEELAVEYAVVLIAHCPRYVSAVIRGLLGGAWVRVVT